MGKFRWIGFLVMIVTLMIFPKSTLAAQKKLSTYVNQEVSILKKDFGQPKQVYPSFYNYDWWRYSTEGEILEFAVQNGRVLGVFTTGIKSQSSPFRYNHRYDALNARYPFKSQVDVKIGRGQYTFKLKSEQVKSSPLIVSGNQVTQLFFDTSKKTLCGIYFMNPQMLIQHLPYDVTYTGALPTLKRRNAKDKRKAEIGLEEQIFQYSNILRRTNKLPSLQPSKDVNRVAYLHSKDMRVNHYFDHYSPTVGDLRNRFNNQGINWLKIGENIAYNYTNGLDVTVGWLNSPGHRVNLLSKEFKFLGVGVESKYYTQNFMQK